MKLFHSPTSPFARKVMACAIARGLGDQITPVATSGEAAELAAVNPLGKLPCLVTDDGLALYDSRVICEYLDGLGGGALFPPAGAARLTALRRQALGDGMLDTGLDWLVERARPESGRSQTFIDAFRRKTAASLDMLERESFAPGLPDIGHIAIAVALGYQDFRFPDERWREGRPRLAGWYEAVAERASMKETWPQEG